MKKIEDSSNGNPRFELGVTLLTPLSETVLQNSNQKNYRLCTVQYVNRHGEVAKASAAIYEGNYSKGGIEVGKEYLATATVVDGKAYIQMSHLIFGGSIASSDDFIDEMEAAAGNTTLQQRVSQLG